MPESTLHLKTPLGEDALLLIRLQGAAELSRLFHYQLDVLAPLEQSVDFARLLGQPARATIDAAPLGKRHLHGIIKRLTEGRSEKNYTAYRLELVPPQWLLTKNVRSRIFTQQSVPDIVRGVLARFSPQFMLTGTYRPRDYVVQYQESDFAFVSRLMEEEGICYFYKHTEEALELHIADDSTLAPQLPAHGQVHYAPQATGNQGLYLNEWEKSQEVCTGRVKLWDHAFQLHGQSSKPSFHPPQRLEGTATLMDSVPAGSVRHQFKDVGGNKDLELFYYPNRYGLRYDAADDSGHTQAANLQHLSSDSQHAARVLMEEEAAHSFIILGRGVCPQLEPGFHFTLANHAHADGKYLVTRVEHVAFAPRHTGEAEVEATLTTSVQCLPLELPFRPRRSTPPPHVRGTQTAIVVGAGDNEVNCATFARVKVQFNWDQEGNYDGANARWVRVAQSWAGNGFGAMHIPRVGQEVVVDFLEGDPDKPIIIGSVYNDANPPPFTLPDLGHVSAFKTHSLSGDTSSYSGLAFSDQKGSEQLQMHAQNDMMHTAEKNHSVHVGDTYHLNAACKRLTSVGGLGVSSGSGSGHPSSSSSSDKFEFGWDDTVDNGFGYDIYVTCGLAGWFVLGYELDVWLPGYASVIIDPFTIFGSAFSSTGLATFSAIDETLFGEHSITLAQSMSYQPVGGSSSVGFYDGTDCKITTKTSDVFLKGMRTLGIVCADLFALAATLDGVANIETASKTNSNDKWSKIATYDDVVSLVLLGINYLIPEIMRWYAAFRTA
ncbi:MAG: type VI secretion system Vgr family protein, partial [Gemmataceae bacterium]